MKGLREILERGMVDFKIVLDNYDSEDLDLNDKDKLIHKFINRMDGLGVSDLFFKMRQELVWFSQDLYIEHYVSLSMERYKEVVRYCDEYFRSERGLEVAEFSFKKRAAKAYQSYRDW